VELDRHYVSKKIVATVLRIPVVDIGKHIKIMP
jgi:hypothetical protein